MSNKQKSITQAQLIQTIKDNIDGNSGRFAFLLGAGASVSSGIPAGGELARQWLDDIKHRDSNEYRNITKGKDPNKINLASLYSEIYQHRFIQPEDGYNKIEEIMTKESVKPSLGYIVLADFLIKTLNNVVITTNFDRLPETALLTTFSQHAKVIYHENMLPIVTMEHSKPMIVKIHNDAFFQPLNNNNDIADLSEDWKKIIDQILNTYHLIVLGYGGNDREGLKKYLAKNKQTNHIYWCVRGENEPPKDIDCHRVQIEGFDDFMYALYTKLPKGKVSTLDEIQERININAKVSDANLNKQIEKLNKSPSKTDSAQEFLESFTAKTWWDYQLKIDRSENNNEAERLYKEGMKNFPNSHELCGNYAIFVTDIVRDYEKAERYYLKSLKIKPNDPDLLGNYAVFLEYIQENYDEAEKIYQKALASSSPSLHLGTHFMNYANFLNNARKDNVKAEKYYKLALKIHPDFGNFCANYAGFLLAQGRKQEALPYIEKAEQNTGRDDTKLELLFYRLAHFSDNHSELRNQIKKLLEQNIRSIGWKFDANIERAEQDGCTFVDELRSLAERITTE